MGKKIDMTNKVFGRLTVIEEDINCNKTSIYWLCKCECGKIKSIRGSDLRNGKVQSCGCLQKELAAQKNSLNLTGKKFGRLLVIEKTNNRKFGQIVWKCKCECGNEIETLTSYLTTGDTTSCGCYQKEQTHKTSKKDLLNQRFGKLLVVEETQERKEKNIIWKCQCDCGNFVYVRGTSLINDKTHSCGCLKSKGENFIAQLLNDNHIPYVTQQSFNTCRFCDTNALAKFDFYIDNAYLLEFDGEQHFGYNGRGWNTEQEFNKRKIRDEYKNQWCKDNNIPLIRIPYYIDNISINDILIETSPFRVI